jgi:hypothetical protein
MKVVEITVSSGRVFPHPFRSFANLRPAVSLKATLDEAEEIMVAAQVLQDICENLLDEHVKLITANLAADLDRAGETCEDNDEGDDE